MVCRSREAQLNSYCLNYNISIGVLRGKTTTRYTMPGAVETAKDLDPPGGGKETKDGKIRLKQRLQKHYDMSAEQFLKVWYSSSPSYARMLAHNAF